jgi:hypothetical protein
VSRRRRPSHATAAIMVTGHTLAIAHCYYDLENHSRVDKHRAGLEAVGNAKSLRDVLGEHARGEPKLARVGALNDLCERVGDNVSVARTIMSAFVVLMGMRGLCGCGGSGRASLIRQSGVAWE